MIKRIIAAIAVLAIALTGLTACGSKKHQNEDPEYYGVCVDPNTNQRLEDDSCDQGDPARTGDEDDDFLMYAVIWYMLASSNSRYPAVGGYVDRSQVYTSIPPGSRTTMGLNKSGGSIVPRKTSSNKSKSGSKSGGNKSRSGGSKSGGRR